jgi:signal transduction histidine kinase
MNKFVSNIRTRIRKELFLVGSLAILLSAVSIIIGYVLLRHTARMAESENEMTVSQLAARGVMRAMDHQFSVLEAQANCRTCENVVTTVNASYPADEKKKQAYMDQMTGSFLTSLRYNTDLKEHLASEVIPSLSCHTQSGMGVRDIMVTDRFGGIVASTGRTKALYQTDKDWWQAAFNKGLGDFAVGEVIFDENSSSWCLPFAGPIRGKGQEVIGVYAVFLDLETFFHPVRDISIGNTGNLAIVDTRNYLLFYPKIKPFAQKLCDYKELQKLLTSDSRSAVINRVFGHTKPVLAGFTRIDDPLLTKRGIDWDVIAMKETDEIYGGLNRFVVGTSIIYFILVIIAIYVTARIFNVTYMRPAQELEESIRQETNGRIEAEGELKRRGENIEQIIKSRVEHSVLSIERAMTMLKEDASIQIPEKNRNMLDEVAKMAFLLKDSIGKLAYLASIDSGELEIKMQNVDARTLLKNAVLNFESKISARNLKLNLDIPKTPLEVLADATRINDVLTILLDNALVATKTGSIKMSLKYLPKEVEFAVSDTGKGMSEPEVASLFKRSRNPEIGLHIAKGIIEAHKGRIYAKSEQGIGTTIFFRIPVK